jgi:hypothetical protein
MELAAAFILAILGGYAFACIWRLTAFRTQRSEGHHLHFRAAIWGAVWFVAAFVIRIYAQRWWPWYREFETTLSAYIEPALKKPSHPRQVELVITAGYSLIVGPIFGALFNLFTPKAWSLQLSFSRLDKLLYQAQQSDMPVCVTLDTGKVYIGLVVSITDPDRHPPSITLFPMFSGTRDDLGRLVLTTDYEAVYRAFEVDQNKPRQFQLPDPWEQVFLVVIRAASIVTTTMFSPKILEEFNPNWRANIGR